MPIASFADASSAGVLDTEHRLCHLVVGHATTGTTRDARIASVPRGAIGLVRWEGILGRSCKSATPVDGKRATLTHGTS
jgi:hypothetical protein